MFRRWKVCARKGVLSPLKMQILHSKACHITLSRLSRILLKKWKFCPYHGKLAFPPCTCTILGISFHIAAILNFTQFFASVELCCIYNYNAVAWFISVAGVYWEKHIVIGMNGITQWSVSLLWIVIRSVKFENMYNECVCQYTYVNVYMYVRCRFINFKTCRTVNGYDV